MWRHDLIDQSRLLESIGIEMELTSEIAHAVPPELPVPTCPGFTVEDLVRHLGSVYRLVRTWLVKGYKPGDWQRDPEEGQDPLAFLRSGAEDLLETLSAHDPGEPVSTWWPEDRTYGFWRRRMAHESTLHRVDLEVAAGNQAGPIGEDLALDGVDEALRLWFGHRLSTLGLSGTMEATVAVRTGDHSWFTRAGPGETFAWRCTEEEADRAQAQVTGPPAQIYLWLWGRVNVNAVDYEGPFDAISQLWALLRLSTR
ncbi:maleylpyruvate isomerase family mycothiol-dependent enzyme [Amycolatopsis suaedae]|uniref:Maleylpyruvate isomerase family mycothiol-dependent enzyme n=1 Tax=Amycolatopsis suaedae TaxID=2510978 RepID=A0A4Q7J211_9PSEU|nr:maleylpyruvate isomerase family mycothiol-dependent enzyme [Amycolatopsis suaedae]RZQ59974.1 maleylpyruvate isomerase family mycothiol-dependent enzyme [Amycolatopsis suaedae]